MNVELMELALKREIARIAEEIKSLSEAQDRRQQLRAMLAKRQNQLERWQLEGRL